MLSAESIPVTDGKPVSMGDHVDTVVAIQKPIHEGEKHRHQDAIEGLKLRYVGKTKGTGPVVFNFASAASSARFRNEVGRLNPRFGI